MTAVLLAVVAMAAPVKCEKACAERVRFKQAMHECSNRNPKACVRRAILQYRLVDWERKWMWRVGNCETGGTWDAASANPNSTAGGLFQFLDSTWAGTPYGRRGHSRWYAKWAALGAAWMLKQDRAGEWSCK